MEPASHGTLLEEVLAALRAGKVPDEIEGRTVECKVDPSLGYRAGRPTMAGDRRADELAHKVADAAACIANSGGGLVLVGVDDRTGRLDGTDADHEWLTERVTDLTRPPLHPTIEEVRQVGTRLLAVHVPRADDEPHSAPDSRTGRGGRRTTIRSGRRCVELTYTRWAQELETRRLDAADWSAGPSDARTSDVSSTLMERVRALMRTSRDARAQAAADSEPPDVLRTLGVLASDDRLNTTGEVLLVDGSAADLSYRFQQSGGALPSHTITTSDRPLLLVLDEVEQHLDARNPDHPEVRGFVVGEARAISRESLREAVVNAVAHRDYRTPGVGIQIEHQPHQLLVVSGGPLLATVEGRLLTANRHRNATMAKALRMLGLADQVGRGVDTMYRQALLRGHQRPQISSAGDTTRCLLVGGPPDVVIARALADVVPPEDLTAEPLVAIDELRHRAWVSADRLSGPLGRPEAEVAALARAWVRNLTIDGAPVLTLLEAEDQVAVRLSDAMRVRLHERLDWAPARRDDAQASIVEFARWHGQVARRDVATLFDVADVTASTWLSAMADDGLLEVGIRAGRYAHYVAPHR